MARYIDAERLNLYDDLFMSEDTINKSGVYVRYKAVENLIENAPTADVQEVKRGYWIDPTTYCGFTCSICKEKCITDKYKYCPRCGAKMYEGEI